MVGSAVFFVILTIVAEPVLYAAPDAREDEAESHTEVATGMVRLHLMKLSRTHWALVGVLLAGLGEWAFRGARIPRFPGSFAADLERATGILWAFAGVAAALWAIKFIITGLDAAFERSPDRSRSVRIRSAVWALGLAGCAYMGVVSEHWLWPFVGWLWWATVVPTETHEAALHVGESASNE